MPITRVSEPAAHAPQSQVVKAQLQLRQLILAGEIAGGARIYEPVVAERLGISRTPIREALMRLEQEGMLEAVASGRGYKVRVLSQAEVSDAIELRGTMEGLAARMAAERGVDAVLLEQATRCLGAIDQVLAAPELGDAAFSGYVALNSEFHDLLLRMAGSSLMQRELERVQRLPFASPSGFVRSGFESPGALRALLLAQEQHRAVLEAIAQREGARAEALMKEHSRIARRNFQVAMSMPERPGFPGAQLIRDA